jgi:hypothetical protein
MIRVKQNASATHAFLGYFESRYLLVMKYIAI